MMAGFAALARDRTRDHFYGEHGEGVRASRMIHDGRYKLIYYPVGSRGQLFDLDNDPRELHDLGDSEGHRTVRDKLIEILQSELYGADQDWLSNGRLVGLPHQLYTPRPDRALANQRGIH